MEFLRFEYVYSIFNVGSLIHFIDGISFVGSERVVLRSEEYSAVNEDARKFTYFNQNTDFENYYKTDHICLMDAHDLTDEQIEQLRKLSIKGVHVTILSNKMNGTEETKTFKNIQKLKENEIIKKRISYICQCGTYDVEIIKKENENSKIYKINGTEWYTECNINCFDDVCLTKEEKNSKDFKDFEFFLLLKSNGDFILT